MGLVPGRGRLGGKAEIIWIFRGVKWFLRGMGKVQTAPRLVLMISFLV